MSKIVVKNGRAVAVRLTDGEEIGVRQVVAVSADPQQLIVDFLGEEHVGGDLIRKMKRYEWGDAYLAIYLALDGPLTYRAGPDAGRSAYVHPTRRRPLNTFLAYTANVAAGTFRPHH